MSSRRSARLSGASPNLKQASSAANDMPPPQVANISKKRKNPSKDDVPAAAPSTPKRKKATKSVPPMTPTPSAIGLMTAPYSSGDIDDSTPPPLNRLAVPNGTNAPLVTPETHRLLANKAVDQVSPSKKGNIKSTTGTLLEEALAHLVKVEPRLKAVIEKHHCHVFSPEGLAEEIDPFRSLVSGIISQQVSGAAAKSIKAKFVALFNTDEPDAAQHSFPTPSQVCSNSIEVLRTAGLSQRKAEYVHGLAQKFHSGEITTEMLFNASYEEVLEELVKVRGLGKWSVEMFACFGLKRMDVFSTGDLGVQRGMAALMGRDVGKLKSKGGKWKYMSEKEMEEISEKFQPYRSVFMWYCWRVEEVDVSTME
ncbi:DNA glycosylase [Hyaloscypha bicolor E]|uniref:DNA glycosylase n=1 Tax=Hyaloscypha bicolor E TaxID=1095630 RepID=A0A2J6T1B9_9HELO|nr:DNA glycosylase [Hyaloscypha bicolor E]PMD56818.1 DNA glycosylase [Hyaloscypha bicolor E]